MTQVEQQGSLWMWLDTDTQVAYPTGDITTQAASKTATAASSFVADAAVTVIDRIHGGPVATAGTLQFRTEPGDVLIREIPLAAGVATNMASHQNTQSFRILGAWRVVANTTGTCDWYIDFSCSKKWTS